jgi:phage shock protein A
MADVGLAVERAKDKTQQMQARASAVEELTAAGTLEDFTSTDDDIGRQLKQIQQGGQVDDELAKLKAELGTGGDEPAKELPGGDDGEAASAAEGEPAANDSQA